MDQETVTPTVGMPATVFYGSDSYAYEVVAVSKSGKTCQIKRGAGEPKTARLTKRGWKVEGHPVALGYGRDYQDPHF